jgi:hypothetical protein
MLLGSGFNLPNVGPLNIPQSNGGWEEKNLHVLEKLKTFSGRGKSVPKQLNSWIHQSSVRSASKSPFQFEEMFCENVSLCNEF